MQDYRNAHATLQRLTARFPDNAYLNSRAGRFFLEVGRKREAVECFEKVQAILDSRKQGAPSDDLISDLLDSEAVSEGLRNLKITQLMNHAFLKVFEGQFESAIELFRDVLTIYPANIVASNNLAVCKVFLNKVGESIKTLEDLTRADPKKNINEPVLQNLVGFYDIHCCSNSLAKTRELAEFCAKHSKDSVNASIHVQHLEKKNKPKK